MAIRKEEEIFESYINTKNLRPSKQRKEILDVFLSNDRHLTADEIYRIAKEKNPKIGFATVYRTLRLLIESGLCRELKFEDGITRYENLYAHKHHDHLICIKCGKFVEIFNPEIEKLQEKIYKEHNFYPEKHKMELYGICKKCRK